MKNSGYVVAAADKTAEVVLTDHPACGRCGACLGNQPHGEIRFRATNEAGAKVGQQVEVEIPPGRAVFASFLIFILPLVCGFAGGLAGQRIGGLAGLGPTAGALIGGSVCFVGSFLVGRSIERVCLGAPPARIVGTSAESAPAVQPHEARSQRRGY
jgi:sigma-E factor negative regulatory protein RseC